MNKAVAGTLMAVALVGAFFLGRASRDPRPASFPSVEADRGALERAAMTSASGPGRVDEAVRARSASGVSPQAPASAEPALPDAGQAGATMAANTGPQPLTEEARDQLRDWAKQLAAHDATTEDLLELSEKEQADADSAYLESLIAASIRKHGATSVRLRLDAPHCTRTLCSIRGIGTQNTQDPGADWQRLAMHVMSEPWFREYFADARTIVGGKKEMLYLTFFIRK